MTVRGLIQRPWQVEAFLAGRRMQVRVRLKSDTIEGTWPTEEWGPWEECEPGYWIGCNNEGTTIFARCPLGAPGDVLAIREAWSPSFDPHHGGFLHYREGFGTVDAPIVRAPRESVNWSGWSKVGSRVEWRSPATMPLWAARLHYRVLDIRVHPVRKISEGDAEDEGARNNHSMKWPDGDPGTMGDVYRRNFAGLWIEQHGPGSWETDWCFAATVERIQEAAP